MLDPGVSEAVRNLAGDPRLPVGTIRLPTLTGFAPIVSRILGSALFAPLRPEAALYSGQTYVGELVPSTEKQVQLAGTLQKLLVPCEWLCYKVLIPQALPRFVPLIAVGSASLHVLGQLSTKLEAANPDMPFRRFMELTKCG